MKQSPSKKSDENIHSFLQKKKKAPSEVFSQAKTPKISQETKKQIDYLLKKQREKPIVIDNNKIKCYLSSLSLRERFADLLNRNELILPPKYKMLLKKQTALDSLLSDTTKDHKFECIKKHFKEESNSFSLDDFEKILRIAPFFYIYQSKARVNGNIELICIDFPSDYEERMKVIIFLIC